MSKNLKIIIYIILGSFFVFFLPFWSSIALAGIFSFLLFPLLCRLDKHHKVKGKRAVGAVIITTLILLLPLGLVFYAATSRVMVLAKESKTESSVNVLETKNIKKNFVKKIKEIGDNNNMSVSKETISGIVKITDNIENKVVETSKAVLIGIPEFTVHLLIFTLAFYVFLYYGLKIKSFILKFKLLNMEELNELITVMQDGCYQTVISLLIVGTIQAGVVLFGAWFAGFDELLLIFSITFILSFIPVVGAAPVAFILSAMKFLEQDWKVGLFLIGIAVFAGTVDNIIKPLLLKRKSHLDGAIALISIIGAILILGMPGLFIGPVVGYAAAYYFEKLKT